MSMDSVCENVIENIRGQQRATLTLASGGRLLNRIKKLKETNPDEVEIVAENMDGSICAHIPFSWVKISPPRQLSEAQAEHLKNMQVKINSKNKEDN